MSANFSVQQITNVYPLIQRNQQATGLLTALAALQRNTEVPYAFLATDQDGGKLHLITGPDRDDMKVDTYGQRDSEPTVVDPSLFGHYHYPSSGLPTKGTRSKRRQLLRLVPRACHGLEGGCCPRQRL